MKPFLFGIGATLGFVLLCEGISAFCGWMGDEPRHIEGDGWETLWPEML